MIDYDFPRHIKRVNDILLVESDEIYLHLFCKWLFKKDLSVDSAINGKDALEKLAHTSYRLMVTGFEMPKMNGLELAEKAAVYDPNMPVIMLISNLSSEVPKLAQKAGIAKVIIKSFDPLKILADILTAYDDFTHPKQFVR